MASGSTNAPGRARRRPLMPNNLATSAPDNSASDSLISHRRDTPCSRLISKRPVMLNNVGQNFGVLTFTCPVESSFKSSISQTDSESTPQKVASGNSARIISEKSLFGASCGMKRKRFHPHLRRSSTEQTDILLPKSDVHRFASGCPLPVRMPRRKIHPQSFLDHLR